MLAIKNKTKRVLLTTFISIIFIGVLLSWLVAGYLINQPIDKRYDACQPDSIQFCATEMTKLFHLDDVKIEVSLTSYDGTQLKGLYFPSRNGAVVVVQHGLQGQMGNVMHIANILYQHGYGVITMDLRAHGKSSGELVTFGRDESKDMQLVLDYVASREEVDPEKIGLYGWSLGGATVLLSGALSSQVKAVVADSPFDGINTQNITTVSHLFWPIPSMIHYFIGVRADVNLDKEAPIAHLNIYKQKPLFLMIPRADQIVDPQSGERLLKKLNNPNVVVWREPSFGHVRFSFDAPKIFTEKITRFFAQNLKPNEFVPESSKLKLLLKPETIEGQYSEKFKALSSCFPHC